MPRFADRVFGRPDAQTRERNVSPSGVRIVALTPDGKMSVARAHRPRSPARTLRDLRERRLVCTSVTSGSGAMRTTSSAHTISFHDGVTMRCAGK